MKINLQSKLDFKEGDRVYIDIPKKRARELEMYNIEVAQRKKFLIRYNNERTIIKSGIVVDMDSVYQPTLSKDFKGVKVQYGKEYWILPKWCFKKVYYEDTYKNKR